MTVPSPEIISVEALLDKTTRDSQLWNMDAFLAEERPRTLSFLNAHAVTTSRRNPVFAKFLYESDMLLRDGIGVKMALALFGYGKTENLNGTDLITLLLYRMHAKNIALFGSSDETLAHCRDKLNIHCLHNVFLYEHGFHDDEFYIQKSKEFQTDAILLCMGMPRQEIVAQKLKDSGYEGLIICGGGWADFYSGVKPRAPLWMRNYGLEWFHRLMNEPKRLGKRYTVDIVYFFYVVLKDKFQGGPKA